MRRPLLPRAAGFRVAALVVAAASGFALEGAQAATPVPAAFTDAAAFAQAIPGGVAGQDFEAFADGSEVSGSLIAVPGAASTIGLPPPIADPLGGAALSLRIVGNTGDNPASSGVRSLGVSDAGNFHAIAAGSVLSFSFTPPVASFGLTIVSPEEPSLALFDGDLQLTAPGAPVATLQLVDAVALGSFRGREYRAYFLGVTASTPFATAQLAAGAGVPVAGFFYQIDDLTIPVPEPPRAIAAGAGALLLHLLARRRTRNPRRHP